MSVICGIASIPGREESLERVLDSLISQVDYIFLVLNYGEHPRPQYLDKYTNVWWVVCDNSKGDAMKFASTRFSGDGYYFSCDDDLIYPPDYVQYMCSKVDQYKSIVTLHGKRYDIVPVKSFRRDFTANIHCLHHCYIDTEVHVGGTGVMAFHTDTFKVYRSMLPEKNMADVQIALLAKQQGVKIIAVAHEGNYLKYIDQGNRTIWRQSKNDAKQTEILNQILS
jgi:hypothetical protein